METIWWRCRELGVRVADAIRRDCYFIFVFGLYFFLIEFSCSFDIVSRRLGCRCTGGECVLSVGAGEKEESCGGPRR
jgi:hypothetical protein